MRSIPLLALLAAFAGPTLAVDVAEVAPDPRISFRVNAQVPIEFTLIDARKGEGGRLTPVFSNYSPRVVLEDGSELQCRLSIPAPQRSVAPGETADAAMSCSDVLVAHRDGTDFEMWEGRKRVALGRVRVEDMQD